MALSRNEVFIKKVLKRLYAETSSSPVHDSSGKEEAVLINLGSKSKENDLENVQALSADASTSSGTLSKSSRGSDTTIPPPRRVYTVSPPPEGYVAAIPDTDNTTVSENSEDSADSTEEEHEVQTKRKRIRRKKLKNNLQDSNVLHGEQVESGMQETLQDYLQLQQIGSSKISKNKRRKMKKKRQKEKMRAAGLLTKTTGVDFTYQPDKSNREGAADLKDTDEKADSILDFLQATQQIYFADNKSKCTDSTVNSAAQGILQCLESRNISSSDLTLLHQMKSLILLQDIDRLKDALKQFQEHSVMPPGVRSTFSIICKASPLLDV
uniref:Glutamate rich 1 n=1 Tax=Phasianus colchicus TaxID=9054 RepID=A0A669QNM2_PHACC